MLRSRTTSALLMTLFLAAGGCQMPKTATPTRLPVARAVWKPRPDLATSAESWLLAGGPHHTVLSAAVGREALADFAEMARTELLVIDEDTDVRTFAKEVRWNQTYYRLAHGL